MAIMCSFCPFYVSGNHELELKSRIGSAGCRPSSSEEGPAGPEDPTGPNDRCQVIHCHISNYKVKPLSYKLVYRLIQSYNA